MRDGDLASQALKDDADLLLGRELATCDFADLSNDVLLCHLALLALGETQDTEPNRRLQADSCSQESA